MFRVPEIIIFSSECANSCEISHAMGLKHDPDDDLASFGQLENYVSAGSFSILTAMLPVLVACFSNKREFLVLAHQPKLRREATELELSEWVAATKVGSGLNYCAEHCSPDNPDLARAAADPPAPAPEEPVAEAPGPAGA